MLKEHFRDNQHSSSGVKPSEDRGGRPLGCRGTEAWTPRMLSSNLFLLLKMFLGVRLLLFLCLNKFDNRKGVLMGAFRLNLDPTLSPSIPCSSESHLCTSQ
ncbi:Hypothetical predicted protein [Xyrichtys novacula]|uniref:Uncharacterized protein n=1 Tax=Xyrichtys novacula TaxID=13765 RepID=A0AAV1FH32_XYRNO|nr:Hypothetical predicted protein [Xyrichtys novacula]